MVVGAKHSTVLLFLASPEMLAVGYQGIIDVYLQSASFCASNHGRLKLSRGTRNPAAFSCLEQ